MKIDLRKKVDANKLQKIINSHTMQISKTKFVAISNKSINGYSLNIYEVDTKGEQTATLSFMENMLALGKIYGFGIMICVNYGTNTPYYYIY